MAGRTYREVWPNGTAVHEGEHSGPDNPLVTRWRTELEVPVPSVRDALGQHKTAQIVKKAGFPHLPAYHPDRRRSS